MLLPGPAKGITVGTARRIAKPFAFLVLVVGLVGWTELSAAVATEFLSTQEAELARLLNAERSAKKLPQLAQSDALRTVARRQAQRMLAEGRIFHSSTLQKDVEALFPQWARIGENVGVGPSIPSVHKAFMESPGHRQNILDPDFAYLGVGVVSGGSKLYMTQNFLTLQKGAPRPVPPSFRLAAANRVSTSQVLSDFGFQPGAAAAAVVAPTGSYHAALVGAALASAVKGPLVLSDSSALPAATQQALQRALGANSGKTVHLVGTFGSGVASSISALGLKVAQVGGGDPVATAAAVAAKLPRKGIAFVTGAGNHPETLPVAAVSASSGWPVLVTDGKSLSPDAAKTLKALGIKKTFVVGGTGVVSDAVAKQLASAGAPVAARLAGANATAMSLAIADFGLKNAGMNTRYVQVAAVNALPDTLAAGANGPAVVRSPVLVTNGTRLDGAVANWLKARKVGVDGVYLLGPTSVLSGQIERDVAAALK